MKLRIRGNSVRLRVSRTELTQIAATGKATDSARFAPGAELRYGLEVCPSGALTAEFDGAGLRVLVPRAAVDRWLSPEEVAIEGLQPVGHGVVLRILVEKDYTCLAPRGAEDDSDLFANPEASNAPAQ
jgi:hypothetical protein